MQAFEGGLHRLGYGVALGEGVVLKQGVEYRLGDEVLGQHTDGVVLGDAVVQVVPEARQEAVEYWADAVVFDGKQGPDAGLVAPCNCLDVGGPLFPIAGVGVPVHDPGQDDVAQLGGSSDDERQCALDGGIIERIVGGIVIVAVAADAGIAWIFRLVLVVSQGQLVDLGFKAVIVSTDGVDDLPDGLVRAVAYGFLGRSLGGLGDGQDDVAELLALGPAHHPAHRLYHVNVRLAGVQEQDGVQGWHINALGKAAGVGVDAKQTPAAQRPP